MIDTNIVKKARKLPKLPRTLIKFNATKYLNNNLQVIALEERLSLNDLLVLISSKYVDTYRRKKTYNKNK